MDVNYAFEILNLPKNSSKEQIKENHRKLIKKVHPREIDENHDDAALLNNARDIALEYIDLLEVNNSLLIKQVCEIIRIDNALIVKEQNYKLQSEAILNKISKKNGSKYRRLKSQAKLFGTVSAIITVASSNILPIFKTITKINTEISIIFALFTFIIALYYTTINSKVEKIQDSIDELRDILDDRASYYDIFNHILLFRENKDVYISKNDIEKTIHQWLRQQSDEGDENDTLNSSLNKTFKIMFNKSELNYSIKKLVYKIGIYDFTKLLISKGLEKGVILEEEFFENKMTSIKYKININK